MKRLLPLLVFSACCLAGCRSKNEEQEKKEYYPIAGYIKAQLSHIDSMPAGILHYQTAGGKTDSLVIEKAAFRSSVAEGFISADISSADKAKNYKETPFIDAGMGTMTLVYTATSEHMPVRKIDVLLSITRADVHTVYIEKTSTVKDQTVFQKMLWTHNKNCQVITITPQNGEEEGVVVDYYVWEK